MEGKRKGIGGTILLYGIVPIFFFTIIGVFLLYLMDVPVMDNVKAWGSEIPVIGKMIPDEDKELAVETPEVNQDLESNYLSLEKELEEKNQKIAELDEELLTQQKTIEDLTKSHEELQGSLEEKSAADIKEQMSAVVGIYENMTASKAAAIFATMPPAEAAITLSQLDVEKQGELLGKMKDVKKASQLTMLLKEIAMLPVTDQASLTKQVEQLVEEQVNPTATLAETIEGMPPSQSAIIIQSMMGSNESVAMNLMKNIKTTSRAQILAQIATLDSKLATEITANLNN